MLQFPNGTSYGSRAFETFFEDYANFVLDGVSLSRDDMRERLLLGAMGLAGETGEVVDELKKHLFHGKDKIECRPKVVKELGDVLWYYTLICRTMGITLDEIIEGNVEKLTERYPEKHKKMTLRGLIGHPDDGGSL